MKPDGSAKRKLAISGSLLDALVWSPDGTRLAFMRNGYDPPTGYTYAVVVLRLADGQLTTIEDASRPTWAPDGRRLAFLSESLHSFRSGFQHLSVANADGTNRRVVSTEGGIDSQPVWSPHGSLIAVTLPNFPLDVIDAETGQAHQVANEGWNPAWSPEGRRLAFAFYGGLGVTRVAQPKYAPSRFQQEALFLTTASYLVAERPVDRVHREESAPCRGRRLATLPGRNAEQHGVRRCGMGAERTTPVLRRPPAGLTYSSSSTRSAPPETRSPSATCTARTVAA